MNVFLNIKTSCYGKPPVRSYQMAWFCSSRCVHLTSREKLKQLWYYGIKTAKYAINHKKSNNCIRLIVCKLTNNRNMIIHAQIWLTCNWQLQLVLLFSVVCPKIPLLYLALVLVIPHMRLQVCILWLKLQYVYMLKI